VLLRERRCDVLGFFKKAEGTPFTVIVIIVLGLIILFVLFIAFSGKSKSFFNQTKVVEVSGTSCENVASLSACRSLKECKSVQGLKIPNKDCGVGKICCSK